MSALLIRHASGWYVIQHQVLEKKNAIFHETDVESVRSLHAISE